MVFSKQGSANPPDLFNNIFPNIHSHSNHKPGIHHLEDAFPFAVRVSVKNRFRLDRRLGIRNSDDGENRLKTNRLLCLKTRSCRAGGHWFSGLRLLLSDFGKSGHVELC